MESQRLQFRSFKLKDPEPLVAIQSDPEVMRYLGGVQDRDATTRQQEEILHADRCTGLARYAVIRKDVGVLVGFCGTILRPPRRLTLLAWY